MLITLGEIAELIDAELNGDAACEITGFATITNARNGQLSFLANRNYSQYLKKTGASAIILSADDKKDCPVFSLVVDDPYLSYAKLLRHVHPAGNFSPGQHTSAVVHETARIDESVYLGANSVIGPGVQIRENVYIGPGCVIEDDVLIGRDSRFVANVTICKSVQIGERVILHPGVVLGADGFGIANDGGTWLKIPQLGSVVIGDDVEIGANSTVDRGALEDTRIDEGVKIDNQVQIGHNVQIGAHTAIAGACAIAGSTRIGKRCMLGGAAGINGHIEITDDVIITAMSGVSNSIKKPGMYSGGMAATESGLWRRNYVRFKQLDKLAKKVFSLEDKINSEDN